MKESFTLKFGWYNTEILLRTSKKVFVSFEKLLTIFLSINVCLFPAVAIFFAANPSLPQFYCPIIASAAKIEKTDRTRNVTDLNFFHLLPKVISEFTLLGYQFILSANARCASERTFSFTFVTISDEVEAFFLRRCTLFFLFRLNFAFIFNENFVYFFASIFSKSTKSKKIFHLKKFDEFQIDKQE